MNNFFSDLTPHVNISLAGEIFPLHSRWEVDQTIDRRWGAESGGEGWSRIFNSFLLAF